MISAVIFDCDGVLVDSEVLASQVAIEMLATVGLAYDRATYCTRFTGMSDADFHEALDADAIARLGRPVMAELREPMRARYHELSAARLSEVPGARACVAELALAKAVASSSSVDALDRKLRQTALWEHFAPHIYSAEHVARAKPAPDLFLHAAACLNVAPEACLVIEDSIHGVRAARAAGMDVWGFLGGGHMDENGAAPLRDAGAGRVLADWREASELLRGL